MEPWLRQCSVMMPRLRLTPTGTSHLGQRTGKGSYSNDKYNCLCYARHSIDTVVNTLNNEPVLTALTLVLGRCGKGRDSYKMCCDYKVSHRRRRSWETVIGSRGDTWERTGAGPRVVDRWSIFRTKTWRSTSCEKGQIHTRVQQSLKLIPTTWLWSSKL